MSYTYGTLYNVDKFRGFLMIGLISLCWFLAFSTIAEAGPPLPPLPTLVPPTDPLDEQIYQLQKFARLDHYRLRYMTAITTTNSGATWYVERRFTYGEASIVIVVMALVLVQVFSIMYRVVTRER